MIKISVCSPSECSPDMLSKFCELVLKGGEVEPGGLPGRVNRAAFLAFALEGEALVGVAALKNPGRAYSTRVFQKARGCVTAEFPLELGWVYVVPDARGKGASTLLVKELCKQGAVGVYATSRAKNTAMHCTLRRAAFEVSGFPYPSKEHPGEDILLFLRHYC